MRVLPNITGTAGIPSANEYDAAGGPRKPTDWIEVVGLTRDEKHYGLEEEMKPGVFLPLRGIPVNWMNIVIARLH